MTPTLLWMALAAATLMYQIVSSTKIRIKRNDRGYFTYTRCSEDPFWQADNPK